MNDQMKKKMLAVGTVLVLIVSSSVGYMLVSQQGLSSGRDENGQHDTLNQETIIPTDQPSSPLKASVKAGPVLGYPPLVVSFYGNPENDSRIVSYHWEFGPTNARIIPQANFNKIKNLPFTRAAAIVCLGTFIFSFFSRSPSGVAAFGLLFPVLLLNSFYIYRQQKTYSDYESTERDPIMVFAQTGSYSATLTVTDVQGNTSSDMIWITVLQYVSPDHDDD